MKKGFTKKTAKFLAAGLATVMVLGAFTGCGKSESKSDKKADDKTITVGATPSPHAEILKEAKDILKKQGYELKIVEYNDYVQPNLATQSGDLDANYFQHNQYLEEFNKEKGTSLVSVGNIHYEPFGIYAGKTKSIDKLAEGAKVAVPNDTSNEARALLLLDAQGLIKLKDGAGLTATKKDIKENPKKLDIVELEAAQIPRSLKDVDIAVINGNYALSAGLNAKKDALATEDAASEVAKTYANILVVKKGNENNAGIQALYKVLKSDEIKKFIEDKYSGAVVPID